MPLGITGSIQQDVFGLVYSCARPLSCSLRFSEETLLSVILYLWDLDSFSTICIHKAKKHDIHMIIYYQFWKKKKVFVFSSPA